MPEAILTESNINFIHTNVAAMYPDIYEVKVDYRDSANKIRGTILTHKGKPAALRPGSELLARILACPE